MSVMSSDLLACVSYLRAASEKDDRLPAVMNALKGMVQRPVYSIDGDLISARFESSLLQIKIDGPDRFRTYLNSWPSGGSVASYSAGKEVDSAGLVREMIDFEGIRKGI